MHLIPQPNGVSFASGGFLGITRLEIDGGQWLAPAINTAFNPFTIFEIGEATVGTNQSDEWGGLFIRNVQMGFSGSVLDVGILHGSATADIDDDLYGGSGDPRPIDIYWGAWALGGQHIELDNVDFVGFSQLAGSGGIVIRWNRCKMRKCTSARFKTGGSGSATGIFRLRPRFNNLTEYFEIQNLLIRGSDVTSGSWGNIFNVEPNANSGTRNYRSTMTWDNVQVIGFGFSGSPTSSRFIACNGGALPDLYWTGSPTSYRNLTVKNCNINKLDCLFAWVTPPSGSQNFLQNTKIIGNEASEGYSEGIIILAGQAGGTPQFDHIEIKNNRIWNYAGIGIYVAQDYWQVMPIIPGNPGSQVMIIGNTVFGCDSGGNDEQIYISTFVYRVDVATHNQRIYGIIRDNDCRLTPLDSAYIRLDARDNAGVVVDVSGGFNPADYGFAECPVRGVITSWDYPSVLRSDARYVEDGNRMIMNNALLRTP